MRAFSFIVSLSSISVHNFLFDFRLLLSKGIEEMDLKVMVLQ